MLTSVLRPCCVARQIREILEVDASEGKFRIMFIMSVRGWQLLEGGLGVGVGMRTTISTHMQLSPL
jgi:hypothetical protein